MIHGIAFRTQINLVLYWLVGLDSNPSCPVGQQRSQQNQTQVAHDTDGFAAFDRTMPNMMSRGLL